MNIKSFLSYLTGYWFHKRSTLPVGVDLFHDIQYRFRYKNISVVFDVGANIGQTAHWVRHHISSSRIYCFEPIRSVYEQLVKNTVSIKKIKTESIAFGYKNEEIIVRLHKEHTVLNSLKSELMSHDQDSAKAKVKVNLLDNNCSEKKIQHINL